MSFAKDNKNRIALGGGIYNFMKHGSDDFNQSSIAYNFEYFSKKRSKIPRRSVVLTSQIDRKSYEL